MLPTAQATSVNHSHDIEYLMRHFLRVREQSEAICTPLEVEDYGLQAFVDASPPKWHIAHTSWFFETFLLKPYLKGYKVFQPLFAHLFNSYYEQVGSFHARPERGLLARPTVVEIYQYRKYVDEHMQELLSRIPEQHERAIRVRTAIGINHEQQHQELLLTDIKFNYAYSPLKPIYRELQVLQGKPSTLNWIELKEGVYEIGVSMESTEFAFDNETPGHRIFNQSMRMASRPTTNGEFMLFMQEGGYARPEFWLSEGWKTVQLQHWQAPLYWEKLDNEWYQMTLGGMRRVDESAPVSHVSHYEADAYARWAGMRLPSEAEWEILARDCEIEGNFVESDYLQPMPVMVQSANTLQQIYGDVWEWTQSPYTPYPGYHAPSGALGEYNGKFMSSQMVLRGGSCFTPRDHIRPTYRNFFYPGDRWQCSGFRLAEDI